MRVTIKIGCFSKETSGRERYLASQIAGTDLRLLGEAADGEEALARYQQLQNASMEDLLEFQEQHVKNRAKLISIVGDLSIIDVEELEQFGTVQEIQVDQLFVN